MTQPRNTIRTFALICVAVTTVFIIGMAIWLTLILSSPEWCGRALGAEKASPGQTIKGLEACIDILKIQLNADATNSHIAFATVSLCLVALMLIVVAGGRISFTANKSGASASIARDDPGDTDPTPVTVVNPPSQPVPTTEAPPGLPTAEEKGE